MNQSFKKGELLNKMLMLAINSHADQFDRSGKPYILHPLTVLVILDSADEELQCIAIGHDLVEDCGVTYSQLLELGFTERIVDGIRCLTKIEGESYEEYKQKVKSNHDAVQVKMADLLHNMDIKRLISFSKQDAERMVRYFQFYYELYTLVSMNKAVNKSS